jgi:hypothetical protein
VRIVVVSDIYTLYVRDSILCYMLATSLVKSRYSGIG